jgi:TRAP-type C4-dicarboxylate transport system permease small subunit
VSWARTAGRALQRLTDAILIASLVGQFGALSLQVFTRYVMNSPVSWSEEVALHLFVWMIFIGAAYGVRLGAHPSMSLIASIESRFPLVLHCQRMISVALLSGMGLLGGALAVVNRGTLSPNAEISQLFLYGAVPVGAALTLVEIFLRDDLSSGGGGSTI